MSRLVAQPMSNRDVDHTLTLRLSDDERVRIDLDLDLFTLDGDVFPVRRLLGRPTILVLLRYLG